MHRFKFKNKLLSLYFSVVQSRYGDFDDKLRAVTGDGGNVDGAAMPRDDFLRNEQPQAGSHKDRIPQIYGVVRVEIVNIITAIYHYDICQRLLIDVK
jgi:hypothetical protein